MLSSSCPVFQKVSLFLGTENKYLTGLGQQILPQRKQYHNTICPSKWTWGSSPSLNCMYSLSISPQVVPVENFLAFDSWQSVLRALLNHSLNSEHHFWPLITNHGKALPFSENIFWSPVMREKGGPFKRVRETRERRRKRRQMGKEGEGERIQMEYFFYYLKSGIRDQRVHSVATHKVPWALPGMIPEHRAWVGVAPKQTEKKWNSEQLQHSAMHSRTVILAGV